MSNVSGRDNTGTVMTGVNTERFLGAGQSQFFTPRIKQRHAQPLLPPLARRGYRGFRMRSRRMPCIHRAHRRAARVLSCMTLAAMQESKSDIDFSAAAQRPDSSAL